MSDSYSDRPQGSEACIASYLRRIETRGSDRDAIDPRGSGRRPACLSQLLRVARIFVRGDPIIEDRYHRPSAGGFSWASCVAISCVLLGGQNAQNRPTISPFVLCRLLHSFDRVGGFDHLSKSPGVKQNDLERGLGEMRERMA